MPSDDCRYTGDVPRNDKENDKQSDKKTPADQELAAVIQAWPGLPEAVKVGIVAMIKATGKKRG